MERKQMELYVWKGDWGLPSVDPHCLAILAYCKFSGVPIEVHKTGNPWSSPSGNFPVLQYGDETYTRVLDIFTFLRRENWGSDFELSTIQSADAVAFSAMLEERLLPALLQLWWIDEKIFTDVTRPWYANVIPFPLNLFLPQRRQKKAEVRISVTKGGAHITDEETQAKVYREAKECLNLLSYKLGNKPYMFGWLPSSLDALVFGLLAPLLKAPLPNHPLKTHLVQCENLCRMCNEILTSFFPEQVNDSQETKFQDKKSEVTRSEAAGELSGKMRNMILAAIFVLTTMLGFAVANGLVRVTVTEEDPEKVAATPEIKKDKTDKK